MSVVYLYLQSCVLNLINSKGLFCDDSVLRTNNLIFLLFLKEYVYPEARDRQYLLFFHKGAKKSRFDLEKYNQLKDAIAQVSFPKMKVNPSPVLYSGGIIIYNHTT